MICAVLCCPLNVSFLKRKQCSCPVTGYSIIAKIYNLCKEVHVKWGGYKIVCNIFYLIL